MKKRRYMQGVKILQEILPLPPRYIPGRKAAHSWAAFPVEGVYI